MRGRLYKSRPLFVYILSTPAYLRCKFKSISSSIRINRSIRTNESLGLYKTVCSSLCVPSLTRVIDVSHTCERLVAHVCDKMYVRTNRLFDIDEKIGR
jgi:hypothetical protein